MDGVDGRYQDSRTSSPEESLGGSYIKVVLRNGRQYVCEIHEGNAEDLERCMNCGFYTATLVRLVCKDILCEGCFRESRVYVCPAHSIRTEKYQAKSGSLWHNPECNSISIKCPTCGSILGLRSIQEHIEKCHPESGARSTGLQNAEQDKTESSSSRESLKCNAQSPGDCDSALSNVGQSRPPRQVSGTEMDIREPGRSKVNHYYNLRSSQAKDQELTIPKKSEPQPVHNAKLMQQIQDQRKQHHNEALIDYTHSSSCGRGLETNPELSHPVHCAEGVNMVKTGPQNMKALCDHSHHSPETRDPKYGNPENLKPPECIASAEKGKAGLGTSDTFHDYNVRCSHGEDPEFSNPQEPNSSQRDVQAGMERVETCYNGIHACGKCKVRVHFSDLKLHAQLCKVEDSKKNTPKSEVKQEEDDRREKKELDNNIQELKDQIKVLENRLEDIEKPLLKILERLRRGY